jgi:hypothetical protein
MLHLENQAQIPHWFYAEHGKVSTIARELRVHPDAVFCSTARFVASQQPAEQEFRFKPQRRHSDGLASSGESAQSARGRQSNSWFCFVG